MAKNWFCSLWKRVGSYGHALTLYYSLVLCWLIITIVRPFEKTNINENECKECINELQ